MRRRFGVWVAPSMAADGSRQTSAQKSCPAQATHSRGITSVAPNDTDNGSSNSGMQSVAAKAAPSLVKRPVFKQTVSHLDNTQENYSDENAIITVHDATKQGPNIQIMGSDIANLIDVKENNCKCDTISTTYVSVEKSTTSSDISNVCQHMPTKVNLQSEVKTSSETQHGIFSGPNNKTELRADNLLTIKGSSSTNLPLKTVPSKTFSPAKLIQGRPVKGLRLFRLPSIEENDTDIHYEAGTQLDKEVIPSCHCDSKCTCNQITACRRENKKRDDNENDIIRNRHVTQDEESHCISYQRKSCVTESKRETSLNNSVIKGKDQNTPDLHGGKGKDQEETISLSNENLTISGKQYDGSVVNEDRKGNEHKILSDDNKVSYQDNKRLRRAEEKTHRDLLRYRHDGYFYSTDSKSENTAFVKGSLRNKISASKTACQNNLGNEELGKDKSALTTSSQEENHTTLNIVDIDSQQQRGHLENQLGNEENRLVKESHTFKYHSTVLHMRKGNMEVSYGKVEELMHSKVTMQCTNSMEPIARKATNRLDIVPITWAPQFQDLGNNHANHNLTNREMPRYLSGENNESGDDSDLHNYSLDSLEGGEDDNAALTINEVAHNGLGPDKDISTQKSFMDNKHDKKSNIEIMIDQAPSEKVSTVYDTKTRSGEGSELTDAEPIRIINTDNAETALDTSHAKEARINEKHLSNVHCIGEELKQHQSNEHPIGIEITCDQGRTRVFDLNELGNDSLSEDGSSIMDPDSKTDLMGDDGTEGDTLDQSLQPEQRKNFESSPEKMPPPFTKSASSPNLRKPKLRIPRIRVLDNVTCLEDEDSDQDENATSHPRIVIRSTSETSEHAPKPRHFSPSFKRKLSSHKKETDLDQLKVMATRLNLSTRRPSYMLWKERLNSDQLGKLTALHENKLAGQESDEESESDDEGSRMESIGYALSWLKRELIEMRTQDQALARTLIRLRNDLREVKLQRSCAEHEELLEDAMDIEEEREILSELSCDYIPNPFSPTLKQAGLTKLNIETRRFSVF